MPSAAKIHKQIKNRHAVWEQQQQHLEGARKGGGVDVGEDRCSREESVMVADD